MPFLPLSTASPAPLVGWRSRQDLDNIIPCRVRKNFYSRSYRREFKLKPETLGSSKINVGDRVKFRIPMNQDEAAEIFTVIELRGPRLLVELVCDMRIKPVFVYNAVDLISV
jgi:hypothetical protein